MKRTLVFPVLILTLVAARADFVIQQKVESAMQNGDTIMKIKGDKIRVDMASGPAGNMSTIVDLNAGDSTALMHDQKIAMKISAAQIKQMMESMKSRINNGVITNAGAPPLQDTGKTETVGAYDTEIYTWTNNNNMGGTVWVAKNFPNFAQLKVQLERLNQSPMGQMSKGMAPDTSALPGMVVKTKARVQGQDITTTLISAKEEPVDATVFDIPKDYQEMGAPMMPAQPAPTPVPGS
jgi:hypothetical protein